MHFSTGVEQLDAAVAWGVTRPVVLIGGSGIWTEVLSRLVFRSGGCAVVMDDPKRVFLQDVPGRPVVVLGAPFAPRDLIRLTALMRESEARVIAVLPEDCPAGFAEDLRVVGAAAVVPVQQDLRGLVAKVAELGEFPIRTSQRGILVSPVLLRSGHTLHAAIAVDISEGGLGIEGADPLLIRTAAEAQFHLPGASTPITVATSVAWVEDTTKWRVRAGLKFVDLDPIDQFAIRTYQGETVPMPEPWQQ